MDRGSLESLLGQGLSLAQIGRRFDWHEATVSYWMKKYGLEAVQREKYAARGGVDRQQLEKLVDSGASIAEIAATVERSKATVRHWLKRYDLKTKAPAGAPSRPGVAEARAGGQLEALLDCPKHGTVTHIFDGRGYYRCRQCRVEAVARRRRNPRQGGGR